MKLSQSLYDKAQALLNASADHTAVEMLKSAGFSEADARTEIAQSQMEKAAASQLVAAGIDYDQALNMVKAAGIKIKDMANFKPEPTLEEELASVFMKAAEQAFELEVAADEKAELLEKIAKLESELEFVVDNKAIPDEITKLAQSGEFTNEDLEALMRLPSDTLTKVATVQEQPWKMGKAAGASSEAQTDPLLAFILS